MIRTIARYGARHVPGTTGILIKTLQAGRAVQGPSIAEFERSFAAYHGMRHAVAASCGRMAFYYILKALNLPPQSEILFPALTFWVVPEIARINELKPAFVDVDPDTYNMDPTALAAAVTPQTRAVVPTHLYGQPCQMDAIMEIARKHQLLVIEDCAHAIGAAYQGQKTGTFGDASFFSFQTLKGLNTYGGGITVTNDGAWAQRIRELVEAEPWPSASQVIKRLWGGYLQRAFISPYGFTLSMFLAFYIASFFGDYDLTRFIWEKIRPLEPLPESYRRRYSNAQAVIGLKMLENIDALNQKSRVHADRLTEGLKDINAILPPRTIPGAFPVYYQYCIRVSDPATLRHRAIRRGVDVEIMHVDICTRLELFAPYSSRCPGAESTEGCLQLPVYSGLRPEDVERILRVVREASRDLPPVARPG
ncbi:MAG TPA: aminotransferase class I/II-fold pyridoxal phosphate-dependent enzyme [Acidobacteriota bacterium]|nr:aminotransferase class I/II-fold pyridoxal phosphate-dependent enzyme [Acidobacteriota bacterium]